MELANAITHGVGVLLAIFALLFLVIRADDGSVAGFVIYGASLITLYLASTLYHSLIFTRARNLFRKFDHMVIFLLIAGTYTPFCLTALNGWLGWVMLGAAPLGSGRKRVPFFFSANTTLIRAEAKSATGGNVSAG